VAVVIPWFSPEGAASAEGQQWHCNWAVTERLLLLHNSREDMMNSPASASSYSPA